MQNYVHKQGLFEVEGEKESVSAGGLFSYLLVNTHVILFLTVFAGS
jgi:hypothetical protein